MCRHQEGSKFCCLRRFFSRETALESLEGIKHQAPFAKGNVFSSGHGLGEALVTCFLEMAISQ